MNQQQSITIVYEGEDEILHTQEHPFCSDKSCPCHDDAELMQEHIIRPLDAGLITWQEGEHLYYDRQV